MMSGSKVANAKGPMMNLLVAPTGALSLAPTRLQDITADQYIKLKEDSIDFLKNGSLCKHVLQQLKQQDCDSCKIGFQVNLFQHALQAATRALRNGEDEEYIVMTLLHDFCEHTVPSGHGNAASLILGPYLSAQNQFILERHEVFQGYYYYHHEGMDNNKRDMYRSTPYFEACARFCELYDAPSFDPDYPCEPLSTFEPMVQRLFEGMPKPHGDCPFFQPASGL